MKIEELQKYIDKKIQESLHLDYKASPALNKKKRDEIAKDVSAMANSDGGIIIYGIKEKNHMPYELDEGVQYNEIDREWIEQILQSTISPKLPSIKIIPVEVNSSASYYVLEIQKSYSGPHQAPDKKYYKRYNFSSSPMDDYEIRDIRNRQITVERLVTVNVEVLYGAIFSLIVENTGKYPAERVSFEFSTELSWRKPKIFKKGTKFLSPGARFQYQYDLFLSQLAKNDFTGPKEFTVRVNYFHPALNKEHSELFSFDFRDFLGVPQRTDSIEAIVDTLREIKDEFSNITRALK